MRYSFAELSIAYIIIFYLTFLVFGTRASWWYSSMQLSAVSSNARFSENIACNGLMKKQKQLCWKYSDVVFRAKLGAAIAIKECTHQFTSHRWNCTTVTNDVILRKGSREAAFAHAISSAGVVHSITRACSHGELSDCSCKPSRKHGNEIDSKGEFRWGGCEDNVRFGRQFARRFIDAPERNQKDTRALMNLHNNKAGRKAVMKKLTKSCKCHGFSGACSMRTCWVTLNDFRKVGNYLKKKYNGAVKIAAFNEGSNLIPADPAHKKPSAYDVVYLDSSPDYCQYDQTTGSLGTAGRKCNRDSKGIDGCDIMCCGRGYDTKRVKKISKCNCKFYWCCYVKCKTCVKYMEEYYCKPASPNNYYIYGRGRKSMRTNRDLRSTESFDTVRRIMAKVKSFRLS